MSEMEAKVSQTLYNYIKIQEQQSLPADTRGFMEQ